MIKKIILMASMLAFVAGCVSSQMKDISVEAGADSDTDFLAYRHYTWLGSAAIVFDPEGRWEPPNFDADAEIQFLINSALRKRGLYENANDPDLIVAYAAGIDMESMKIKTDKVDPVLRETPILIITGMREQIAFLFPGQPVHPSFVPNDELIEKPVEPDLLLEKVSTLLEASEKRKAQAEGK